MYRVIVAGRWLPDRPAHVPARKAEFLFFANTPFFEFLTFLHAANTLPHSEILDPSHIYAGEVEYEVSLWISAVHIEQKNFPRSVPKNPVFRRYLENAGRYEFSD